jgi:hypothetical protein
MKRSYEHAKQATACRMCRPTANPGLIGGGLPIRSSLLNTVAAFDCKRRGGGTLRSGVSV